MFAGVPNHSALLTMALAMVRSGLLYYWFQFGGKRTISLTPADHQFLCLYLFFGCSDARMSSSGSRRRFKLVKVHVGSPRSLQFDYNFDDTLKTELEDHDNNNSEGN